MEIEKINEIIQTAAGEDAKYIFGLVEDDKMGDEIMVTVIATGFSKKQVVVNSTDLRKDKVIEKEESFFKGYNQRGKITSMPSSEELKDYDKPAFDRREVNLNEDLSENLKKIKIETEDDFGFEDLDIEEDFSKPAFLRRQMD